MATFLAGDRPFYKIRKKSPKFHVVNRLGKYETVVGILERILYDIEGNIIVEYRNNRGFQIRKFWPEIIRGIVW